MAVTSSTWCDFVVWTQNWLSVERIDFDASAWQTLTLPKLQSFFRIEVLPRLLDESASSVSQPSPSVQVYCAECSHTLALRKCKACTHIFHHICTVDDEGKLCSCCVRVV